MCAASPARNSRPCCIGSTTKLRIARDALLEDRPLAQRPAVARSPGAVQLLPDAVVGPGVERIVGRALQVQPAELGERRLCMAKPRSWYAYSTSSRGRWRRCQNAEPGEGVRRSYSAQPLPAGIAARETPWKPSQPATKSQRELGARAPPSVQVESRCVASSVAQAHVVDLEVQGAASGEPCLDQVLHDLLLAVDRDRAATGELGQGDAVRATRRSAARCRGARAPRARAGSPTPVARSRSTVPLLEHAGPHALLDVLAAARARAPPTRCPRAAAGARAAARRARRRRCRPACARQPFEPGPALRRSSSTPCTIVERAVRGRDAAVDRLLQQDLAQLALAEVAALERRARVQAQLLPPAERDHRADHEHAPLAQVEARPRPDLAPGVARDQVLELGAELARLGGARSTCARPSSSRRRSRPAACRCARPFGLRISGSEPPRARQRASTCATNCAVGAELPGGIQQRGDLVGRDRGRDAARPRAARRAGCAPRRSAGSQARRHGLLRLRPGRAAVASRCATGSESADGARPVEVRAHARGVDDEVLERLGDRARAPPVIDQLGQRLPLRLPAAERALVLLRHRRQHRGHEARRAHRGRDRRGRATGLRLCGIDDEPPRPGAARLADLADFGLREQREVAADLAERARTRCRARRRGRRGGRARCATACPRTRELEPRAPGHRPPPGRGGASAASVPVAPPSWSTRARRRTPRARRSRERASAVEPAGGLQPERDRRGLLQPRAPGHGRVPRGARASRRQPRRPRCERASTIVADRARSCSTSAVSMTSWLVAPQCTMPGGRRHRRAATRRGELLHERDDEIAGARGLGGQRLEVVRLGRAGVRIGAHARSPGCTPSLGQRLGERDLDVEHAPGRARCRTGTRAAAASPKQPRQAGRAAHTSKKTVSSRALQRRCRSGYSCRRDAPRRAASRGAPRARAPGSGRARCRLGPRSSTRVSSPLRMPRAKHRSTRCGACTARRIAHGPAERDARSRTRPARRWPAPSRRPAARTRAARRRRPRRRRRARGPAARWARRPPRVAAGTVPASAPWKKGPMVWNGRQAAMSAPWASQRRAARGRTG